VNDIKYGIIVDLFREAEIDADHGK
jgi:hypothetical protein